MTASETSYRLDLLKDHSVVTFLPGLNNAPWADIEQTGTAILQRLESRKAPQVVIDLSPLDYMGSATVALIVRIWKSVQKREGRLVVVNQHEMVYEVLKLAGLTNVWTIVSTRDEGLRELEVGPYASERRLFWVLASIGVLAVLGSAGGFYCLLNPCDVIDVHRASVIVWSASALGLMTGTVAFLKLDGKTRLFGGAVVVICLVLGVMGTIKSTEPGQKEPPPEPVQTVSSGRW